MIPRSFKPPQLWISMPQRGAYRQCFCQPTRKGLGCLASGHMVKRLDTRLKYSSQHSVIRLWIPQYICQYFLINKAKYLLSYYCCCYWQNPFCSHDTADTLEDFISSYNLMYVFTNSTGSMFTCRGISMNTQGYRTYDFQLTRFGFQTFFCITGKPSFLPAASGNLELEHYRLEISNASLIFWSFCHLGI